ncbi:MAG: dihydrolipoyl dehydrogenase [Kiritimatiellia bacterium]
MEKYDLIVIGSGPGGYPAAIRASQMGASVAIVEKDQPGGVCLNWGCIPTKTLIASSELYWKVRSSDAMGLKPGKISFDYGAVCRRKDEVVSGLTRGVSQLLKANGVEFISGTASFTGRNRLTIRRKKTSSKGRKGSSQSSMKLEAGKVIIATGAEPVKPGFLPAGKRVVDSKGFLRMKTLPSTMIVMGGGIIGCEFACMAAQFGVKVTVVELLDDILSTLDRDIRKPVRKFMEGELGITVMTGAPLEDIRAAADGVSGKIGGDRVKGDILLVSVGRRPVTAGLDAAKGGVEVTKSGHIPVDEYCRSACASVYAVGDVTEGSTQLAHAATSQGITAAENALGRRRRMETVIPVSVYTSPEIGSVGLSQKEAQDSNMKTTAGKFQFPASCKARAEGDTNGFVKWIADAEDGRLLGAQAVGLHAAELINEAGIAVRAELTLEEMARSIHCHPTISEAWMEAAHAALGESINQPPGRKKKSR